MSLIRKVHFFNKLRRHLGFRDALHAYTQLRINRKGLLRLSFLQHSFRMRIGNRADMETFNEVFLRRAYDINLDFTPVTIIDAGANIGMTSTFLASKYPNAHIIAIEPDNGNFQLLQENTQPYPNIQCIQAALWNEITTLQLVDTGRGDNSFIVTGEQPGTTVTTTTLAEIIHQNKLNNIDLLKIDIEGAEKQIFSSGYEQWLPSTKALLIELHDKIAPGASRTVFHAIGQYNFSCKAKGSNLVFTNNDLV